MSSLPVHAWRTGGEKSITGCLVSSIQYRKSANSGESVENRREIPLNTTVKIIIARGRYNFVGLRSILVLGV
uniref:Uncharacterized protein n=1 Tax=Tanacetum cinerariifolium TaxID=118510 RepID=A0A699V445_TANCI|nr:hypothetical protein [Tanacetum cinerariifolium]